MSNDSEPIAISNCPVCDGKHTYGLKVKRSNVIKLMISDDMQESPRRVHFTRIFTCPNELKDFQATFILYDTSSSRIESVNVINE